MKNTVIGILVGIIIVLTYKAFSTDSSKQTTQLIEQSKLIEKQLKHVGKLVVTEGHFSEVYTYKKSQSLFGNLIDTQKKALVVVNADVSISYDLDKIEYAINNDTKTVTITKIPQEELNVTPDFEYYDIQADYLNPFKAEDYNTIKKEVKIALAKKLNNSDLRKNAKNRLISELSKFYILTQSLGWTLQYNETIISSNKNLNQIPL